MFDHDLPTNVISIFIHRTTLFENEVWFCACRWYQKRHIIPYGRIFGKYKQRYNLRIISAAELLVLALASFSYCPPNKKEFGFFPVWKLFLISPIILSKYLIRVHAFLSYPISLSLIYYKNNTFLWRCWSQMLPWEIWLSTASRKHLRANVTPSLHLKYSKNGGKPGIRIDKYNISLFLKISINCWKVLYFNTYLTSLNTKLLLFI